MATSWGRVNVRRENFDAYAGRVAVATARASRATASGDLVISRKVLMPR
jgi:hypothetical protein